MKHVFICLCVLLVRLAAAQTADDIINKYFEATGGKDKWAKVYSIKASGQYVMGPGMLAPVSDIEVSKPFKGAYSDFTWQGMTTKEAMRGDSGWSYNPFGGKRETDPMSQDRIHQLQLDNDPQGLLFNYKEKGYTVDYLGTDDMDGSDVYKLRLTTRQGDRVYYYIDAETCNILKETYRYKLKDKEEKSSYVYSDFRKTDYGIIVPYSRQRVDNNNNEEGGPLVMDKMEVNAPVDLTVFDRPKK